MMGRKITSVMLCLVFVFLTACTSAFKKDSVVKALKKCNVIELETISDADRKFGPGLVSGISKVGEYYVSKNREEAKHLYVTYNETGTAKSYSLEEDIVCFANHFSLFKVTAESETSARDIYKFWADYIRFEQGTTTSGKKDGYEYTITYCPTESMDGCGYGVYIKGNVVIYIDYSDGAGFLYKELGLISPYSLKK